tara:strand:+ start:1796 stop:1966 length:171 start_codon:yes stop_codon:yes gene_type:complete
MKDIKRYLTFFLLFALAYLLSKELKEGLINFTPGRPLPHGHVQRRNHTRNIPLFYR